MAEDFKWDQTVFDETFGRYLKVTSRTTAEAINAKAYFVARRAVWLTEKASSGEIKGDLGRWIRVPKISKKTGKVRFSRKLELASGDIVAAPLAALIINKRRGKKGLGGLRGQEMETAIKSLLSVRLRSIAYIKSGWLPAIRQLASLVKSKAGAPAIDTTAKQIGRAKGGALPAIEGPAVQAATILNEAWAKHDKKNAFERFGSRGLQKAFNDEAADMEQYMRDKLGPDAADFNRLQR